MLAILKLFLFALLLVLFISAFCGLVAFFLDLRRYKGEHKMSLPRAKMIQKIIEQDELERQKRALGEEKEAEENDFM